MDPDAANRLQVLIANEHPERLEGLAELVGRLGHDVVAREVDPDQVGLRGRELRADVALVALGESDGHALSLIGTIARTAPCPVIAVLDAADPDFVAEAARRGVFAYVTQETPEELQSAIELVLQRFAAFRNLEGAFGRRALIERAKGILMERHGIGEQEAFEFLRSRSQNTGRKVADVASAVVDSQPLLPARRRSTDADD